jgi:hypothetical protein
MDVSADAGAGIRLRLADLPLVLQEHLELLDERCAASASDDELAGLAAELREPQSW